MEKGNEQKVLQDEKELTSHFRQRGRHVQNH